MGVSAAWERHAQQWIAWARSSPHDGFRDGTWPVLRELLPDATGLVVDLGCGEGRSARELTALGHDVLGVERAPTLVAAARDGGSVSAIVQADASALPLRDEAVGLVVASMSLQDVDDLEAAVSEVARVLRSGGSLCAAIVHPFSSAAEAPMSPAGPVVVSAPYLDARRYEVAVERDGSSMTFVSMHWPLAAYVAALARQGMVVDDLRELGEEVVPWLLAFRATKA